MKASEITEGVRLLAEDGSNLTVTDVMRVGIRMGLVGYADKGAIMLSHRKGWSLCHPDEDLQVATRPRP